MTQREYLHSKSYLVSAKENLVLPKAFKSAVEAIDFSRANNLVQRGYNIVMKGGDVIRTLQSGRIKEAPHIGETIGRGEDGKVPATGYEFFPESVRKRLPPLGATGEEKDPVVQVKFFTPWSNWTWYGIEFDGEDIFYGWVVGFEKEFGSFSLSELQSAKGPMGLKIERDIYFEPKPISQVMKGHGEVLAMTIRSAISEPLASEFRRELRKLPISKLGEAYNKLKEHKPTGIDILERHPDDALNAVNEALWERGALPLGELKHLPQTKTIHLYATQTRQIIDELEKLRRSDPEEFYRKLKIVTDAIKERERGNIKKLPEISLTELREIKKEADLLYR